MSKSEYLRLRQQLSFEASVLPMFAVLVFDVALSMVVVKLLRLPGFVPHAAASCLIPIVAFNQFAVLHECGHGSASKYSWLNAIVGHVASTFCMIPYYPWKFIHQKHHSFTGNIDKDPVLHSLRAWKIGRVPWLVRAAWWSWIPLAALLQHVVYLRYPYVMWKAGEPHAKLWRTLVSVLWLPCSWVLLSRLWPDLITFRNLAPGIVLYFVAEELVNMPHHVSRETVETKLPIWEQYRATRSCYYPPGISELLVLNFNFHIEHHLFPSLPWYRLRQARSLVRDVLAARYQEAVGVGWNVENRRRDLQGIVDGTVTH
jgi:omega-6 fatty acid desaturase (delta-12 desaturase)